MAGIAFRVLLMAMAALAAEGDPLDITYSSMLAPPSLPTEGARCDTLLTCAGTPGVTHTVVTITSTMPGVHPTTDLTIRPDGPGPDGKTTIVIVPSSSHGNYYTTTVTPGETISTSITSEEPGGPGTVIVIPPGVPPASTITVTTSIPGFNPTTTMTFPGKPNSSGGPITELVIPPNSDRPSDWTCSCLPGGLATTTVTVTSKVEPAPTVTTTGSDGKATETPKSKFPCSSDDNRPCRGRNLQKWTTFANKWSNQYPKSGLPQPFIFSVNFANDSILMVTDDQNKCEHFEIKMDGKVIGETQETGFDHSQYCAKDAESCMLRGWSHGHFKIPAGPHTLIFQATKGKFNEIYWAEGQYRFDSVCECPA